MHPISLTIDKIAEAIYIRFSNNKVQKTIEPVPEIFMDLDYRGKVVGIEMINPGMISVRKMKKISRDFQIPQFHQLLETPLKQQFA